MNENENLGAYAIMYVIQNKKNEVISLLLKNGVTVPSNAYNIQIAIVVTNLLKVSSSFYDDFLQLLLNEDTIDEISANMTGSYLSANGNADFCKNTANKTESPSSYNILCKDYVNTATSTSTSTSSSSFVNKGLDLLQSSIKDFLQYDDNKTKRALAEASVKISDNEVTKGEIPPPPTKLSTGAIVGISVLGVTVVGLVIYLIAKKR